MKYLPLILVTLLASFTTSAQEPKQRTYNDEPRGLFDKKPEKSNNNGYDIKPEKGDAQIIVKTTESIISVAKKVMGAGYIVDKMDTTLEFITTRSVKVPGDLSEYYLNISKIADGYKVAGMYRMNMTLTLYNVSSTLEPYELAKFHKAKSHRQTKVFNEAYDVAKLLGSIEMYLK